MLVPPELIKVQLLNYYNYKSLIEDLLLSFLKVNPVHDINHFFKK